jgi:integrase
MRLGDCCTLRWGETDLTRGIIRKDTRKTGKAVQIPIHAELLALLKLAEGNRAGEYVLPEYSADYLRRNSTVTDRIQKHFADCGIVTAAPERKQRTRRGVQVGFHSLRHSFVSLCAGAGVSLAAVQSIVGHTNPSMTRHYTHLGIEAARGAIAALPALIEPETTATKVNPSPTLDEAVATIVKLAEGLTAKNRQARQKKFVEAAKAIVEAARIMAE